MKALKSAHIAAALLGASAFAPPALQGQDGPYSCSFRIRGGLFGGDMQQAHCDNKVMGFGLQAKRALSVGHAVSLELTYERVTGRHFDITDWASIDITQASPSNPLNIHPYDSFDDRKEAAQGFSLLCAYHSKLPPILGQGGFEWFAGVRLDRHKVYSEFKWTFYDRTDQRLWIASPTASVPSGAQVYGGGNGTFHEEGAALVPGAFGGIKWGFSENVGFEVGLRYFGMKHWDFTPGAYLGREEPGHKLNGGELKSGTTWGYSIEFALSCRI